MMIRELLLRAGRITPAAKVDLKGRAQRESSVGQTANHCTEE